MDWIPPDDWMRITSIDCHAAGEPLRVITGGWPDLPGDSVLERRRYQKEHFDHLRRAVMFEPRGHADMYGCLITPPVTPDADVSILFMHNEGYSTMCGHGIIGYVTVALETGLLPVTGDTTTVRLDTPAGLVTAHAMLDGGRVANVAFENVPSFVLASDQTVDVPGIGSLQFDVAFGGAFYAFCRAEDAGVSLTVDDNRRLIEVGMAIKHAVMDAMPITHPFEEDLSFLYGTIFIGEAHDKKNHSRNVCIFAEGEVDRCPTGTGVSARAAIHYGRDEIDLGDLFTVESIVDTTFTGRVLRTEPFGDYEAVVPEVSGTAHITGRNEWLIDPTDPLRDGFILR